MKTLFLHIAVGLSLIIGTELLLHIFGVSDHIITIVSAILFPLFSIEVLVVAFIYLSRDSELKK